MQHLGGRPSRAAWRGVVPVLALGAFLVAAVGVAAQAAQATDPLSVLQRFVAARNAGDEAGAMALVADDIRFVGSGPVCNTLETPCVGRAVAQQTVVQLFIRLHAHLTIVGTPQVSGSQVTARTEGSDDRSKAAGVDRFISNLTVEVRDGKIVRWVSLPDASDPQTATFLASPQAQPAAPPAQLPRTGAGGGTSGWPGLAAGGALGVVLLAGLGARRLGGASRSVRRPGAARRCRPSAHPTLLILTLALGLALGLVAPRRSTAQGAPPAPPPGADPVAPATAFNAAWNAGQVEPVMGLLAADATVRQRDADLEGSGPNVAVRDLYGVAHTYVDEPPPGDGRVVTWAAGAPAVRAWARGLLAAGHRVEATGYRTGGDGATATWDYAATTAATRRLPGVGPTAGTAELTVRGGRIVSLTLTSDPASVAAREASLWRAAAAGAARAAQATAVAASGVLRRTPDTQGRGTPASGPWIVAAALSFAGVVLLAMLKRPIEAP